MFRANCGSLDAHGADFWQPNYNQAEPASSTLVYLCLLALEAAQVNALIERLQLRVTQYLPRARQKSMRLTKHDDIG
jgi:hypothetical protein